jgi:hypothetical protein
VTVEDHPVEGPEALTVQGKPVPAGFAHLIPRELTDQGIAERNARPNVRADATGARVTEGPFEKSLRRMQDQPWAPGANPFSEPMDQVRRDHPGMRVRALSPRVCGKRGLRGWEPAVGKDGEQVRVAGMFMGIMPEDVAEERNAYFAAEGNDALRDIAEQYEVAQEKVIRDGNGQGLSILRPGEVLQDERDPERAAVSGLHVQRGSQSY